MQTRPYQILRPVSQKLPIVLASPHSGDTYPLDLIEKSRLSKPALRRSEDAFVDSLFSACVSLGVPLIRAFMARIFVDLNREPYELDPGMFDGPLPSFVNTHSPRVAAGLGTVARINAVGEEIYRGPLCFDEVRRRIEEHHLPYHAALTGLIEETRQRFGYAILIDCHSMPSRSGLPEVFDHRRVDFVLGDCHRSACDPGITGIIEGVLERFGYTVVRNRPYAGGYTTRHYGKPDQGVHALQIEVNRALYMDERRIQPASGFDRVSQQLVEAIDALGRAQAMGLAAE